MGCVGGSLRLRGKAERSKCSTQLKVSLSNQAPVLEADRGWRIRFWWRVLLCRWFMLAEDEMAKDIIVSTVCAFHRAKAMLWTVLLLSLYPAEAWCLLPGYFYISTLDTESCCLRPPHLKCSWVASWCTYILASITEIKPLGTWILQDMPLNTQRTT